MQEDQSCPFEKVFPSRLRLDDTFFMYLAYNEAIDAWREDEVPVGAIIESGGEVIGSAHNQVESTGDPTAHAEVLAITQAARAIGDWRLNSATLYVTKEPCPMCSGALIMSRVGRLVYGAADPRMGCMGGAANLNDLPRSNHTVPITPRILEQECTALLQAFFRKKRKGPTPEIDCNQ